MSLKYKFLAISLLLISFVSFNAKDIFATNAELKIYPESGSAQKGDEFSLDVLVDTKGQEVVLVRAALKFDSNLVEVTEVEKSEVLFCDWPADEQLIDNSEGIVVVTGFCQSGTEEDLYSTVGDADVFARLTFNTLNQGQLNLQWEYSGADQPNKSVIMSDGSPPQNILVDPNSTTDNNIYTIEGPEEPKMPDTNISALGNISSTFLLGGSIFMLAFVANILLDPKRRYFRKSRTIVVYDDEEK